MTFDAQVGETTIEIDTSEMEKKLLESMDQKYRPMFENYLKEFKESKDKERGGKGVVEAFMPNDTKTKIIEELSKGAKCDPQKIKEQWTIALPKQRRYETAGHLRDFVYVTDVIKGKVGDVVEIPYVKDVEFEFVTAGTGSFSSAWTGLVSTITTTLYEAGGYYDAYYTDIEKINQNLLDELNAVFAHAAVRAEDQKMLQLLEAGTTSDFGETAYGANCCVVGDTSMAGSTFNVSWIADAIGNMIRKGKDVHPGELVLYMNPTVYAHFLKKVTASGSTAYAFARSDVLQSGMVEEWLGVRIITGGFVTGTNILTNDTTYQTSWLMRPKRCIALAPKRDILIETDKIIASRTLRIAASHTFGTVLLDQTEAVPIFSGVTGS